MKQFIQILAIIISIQSIYAQRYKAEELFIGSYDSIKLSGTLLVPKKAKEALPLAIIIAGSGPTNRNGNSGIMSNNSLKYLAEGLSSKNIATFRYDKRGVGRSLHASIKEENLRFEDFINDAVAIVNFFEKDKRFNSIALIGHSEGSLIGMMASRETKVEKFISVSGAGKSADVLLKEQLKKQYALKNISPMIDSLKAGYTIVNLGKLKSLFRPSVQPYIISWFKYHPQIEIKKLSVPVLILQGDKDIQVKVKDANLLKAAYPVADLEIIPNMNHVLKIIEGDFTENLKSYYNSEIPVSKKLIKKIIGFLNE